MSPKRKTSRRAAPPSSIGSISGWAKMAGSYAGIVVAIGTFLGGAFGVYVKMGGAVPVWNHEFIETIGRVKTEVGERITAETGKVVDLSNKNTGEVKRDVSNLGSEVANISRKTDAQAAQIAAASLRTLFVQKSQATSTLNQVEVSLAAAPNDYQLRQRKSEVEGVINYLDREITSLQDQLRQAGGVGSLYAPGAPPAVAATRPR